LQDTSNIDLAQLQTFLTAKYEEFRNQGNQYRYSDFNSEHNLKTNELYRGIVIKLGKNSSNVSKEEFEQLFPELIIEEERRTEQCGFIKVEKRE
jgi:hypothetical protein